MAQQGHEMEKLELQQRCEFCHKQLVLDKERKQKLCADCYDLRRVIRRLRKRESRNALRA